MSVFEQFVKIKKEDPSKLDESAEKITKGIASLDGDNVIDVNDLEIDKEIISMTGLEYIGNIDMVHGGRRGAPKFPMPNMVDYIMKYYHFSNDERAKIAARITLDEMAKGGIFDHVGGGFSRYSVDSLWLVPHFEKMLYDNGQLLTTYANAYKLFKSELYKSTIEKTVSFLNKELKSKEGAFFSSLDADSEREEGKYYVWQKKEVDAILGKDSDLFCALYDVSGHGNWEEKNILRLGSQKAIAAKYNISEKQLDEIVQVCLAKLDTERSKRVRPGTDDKILTSWNALAIKGLIDAHMALGNKEYYDMAKVTTSFVLNKQMQKDGRLYRNYKNGKSTINGFLDDYTTTIDALISIYQADFNEDWLQKAKQLTDYVTLHFSDENKLMFYYTSDIDPPLVTRKKEMTDNVISSSNSIMARNLYKLGELLYNETYLHRAKMMGNSIIQMQKKSRQTSFYANWSSHYLDMAKPLYEVAILGDQAAILNAELQKEYYPNALFLGGKTEGNLELLKDKLQEGETMIYVCQNKTCRMPVRTGKEAKALIQ